MKTPFLSKDTRPTFINTFFLKNLAKTPSRTSLCSIPTKKDLIKKGVTNDQQTYNHHGIYPMNNKESIEVNESQRVRTRITKVRQNKRTKTKLKQLKLDSFCLKCDRQIGKREGDLEEGVDKNPFPQKTENIAESLRQLELPELQRRKTTLTTLSSKFDVSHRLLESKVTAPSVNKTGVFKNANNFLAFNLQNKNGLNESKTTNRFDSMSNHNRLLSFFNQNKINIDKNKKKKNDKQTPKNCPKTPYDQLYDKMLKKSQVKEIVNRKLDDPDLNIYYTLDHFLGKGSFAEVRLANRKSDNMQVAVKTYCNLSMQSKNRKNIIENEIKILKKIEHKNIVKLLDVVVSTNYTHIILEYIEGINLYDFMWKHKQKGNSEADIKNIMSQLSDALIYLHSVNIYHRDIKPDNVIVNKEGKVTLIDFGFSIYVEGDEKIKTYCGTPNYMAPELYRRIRYRGSNVDTWAFVVLLFKLATKEFPFKKNKQTKSPKQSICQIDYQIPSFLSDSLKNMFKSFFTLLPDNRLSLKEIREMEWFN